MKAKIMTATNPIMPQINIIMASPYLSAGGLLLSIRLPTYPIQSIP